MSSDGDLLRQRLAAEYEGLTTKQRVVARALADEPESIVYSSVEAFGRSISVDPATIVRTCQKLGFAGWSDLRDEVRRAFERRPTFAERAAAFAEAGEDSDARIFETAASNVTRTYEGQRTEDLSAVASMLAGAGSVAVVADGVSRGPAEFLSSSLQIIGLRSTHVAGVGQAGTLLSSLRDDDLVVAISVWRYLRPTVQAARIAYERGLNVVAVTDSHVAPVALTAHRVLVAKTASGGPRLSLVGMMALIEALVARVAADDPERTRAATLEANRLYYDGNVVESEAASPSARLGGVDGESVAQRTPGDDGEAPASRASAEGRADG